MSNFKLTYPLSEKLLEVVRNTLGEDEDRLNNRREIFKQWLVCESHLPKDIDQKLIDNFIRLSKFDIERAKRKFEMYLYSRTKNSLLYGDLSKDKYLSMHRHILVSRGITEDGYKVMLLTFRNIDMQNYNFDEIVRHGFLCAEYFFLNDINCGYKVIFDMEGFDTGIIPKVNISHFKAAIEIITKVQPTRLNEIHIVNLPTVAQGLYLVAHAIMPEKIKKRIISHKDWSTVLDYIKPNDILPNEFGGSDGNFFDLVENARDVLVNDESFQRERAKWFLIGELPADKKEKYLIDDFGASGSFRKLQID